ncbi:hypothetical protein [Bacteroides sp. 519]|uniref:hypothetical protein n=1 Tax=Bacteroides sp. 519 TaxID=2302937 RepID=UPI0013D17C0A|nr:hypothetical protein [Bacteroides sp. 519]
MFDFVAGINPKNEENSSNSIVPHVLGGIGVGLVGTTGGVIHKNSKFARAIWSK